MFDNESSYNIKITYELDRLIKVPIIYDFESIN